MLSRFERELKDCEMKKILITGADSYIGTSFETWLAQPKFKGLYEVDTIDMRNDGWKEKDFSPYDAVFHVAGIAHVKETKENRHLYYEVNRDLAIETAKKAKKANVGQFVLLSSMSVYGIEKGVITDKTISEPQSSYGRSKLQADIAIQKLANENLRIAILRPPMVYGRGCKGNYVRMSKLAQVVPIFPDVNNERSMIYIGNLCEFVRLLIENGAGGLYFPQNAEYAKTSEIVKEIAKIHKKKIWVTRLINPAIYLLDHFPGRVGEMVTKAFGSLVYEKNISQYSDFNYQLYSTKDSIRETESQDI